MQQLRYPVVDLATPALDTAGTVYEDKSWYWHRRTFDVADISFDVIRLKIFKAKYHTKVYVNGEFVGENHYCFTPSYFDIKPFLFFENPDRGTLPWDDRWTLTLHERFKDMHWDVARYCIGFPPERWYEVCDSLGFMVQDEFSLWDTQNETVTPLTGEAQRHDHHAD